MTTTTTAEERRLVLPFSEVCMFMGIAGKEMTGRHVGHHMVQLVDDDGRLFSAPITEGEAGWNHMGSDLTLCHYIDGRWFPGAAPTERTN